MHALLHHLIWNSSERHGARTALKYCSDAISYDQLGHRIRSTAAGLCKLGIGRSERVAIYLEKRIEAVDATFGAAAAGAVFVPVNPLLKAEQVGYILRDCNVRILVTSTDRYDSLAPALADCPDLRHVILIDADGLLPEGRGHSVSAWSEVLAATGGSTLHRVIDTDMAAILYTSGSTGKPKGVVLSHRNMVAGAMSVAEYLENVPDDRILSVLPLSFDAGFSQLTTAFHSGACAVLLNYLLPKDAVNIISKENITGITAVPPLWIQLAALEWPSAAQQSVRYFANTGGRMPRTTLDQLRRRMPRARPFLMYGLTEAFRSTFLPPDQVDCRPDSIGKAIPNAEILVVREDGTPCNPGEPGELVHRGALVSLGYWNDPEKTSERFRPAPGQPSGLPIREIAVWSGDTVRCDDEGYIYFIGRRDEMIKTSGYRVSPTEVEEVLYATGLVDEAAALGVPHPALGQSIVAVVHTKSDRSVNAEMITAECRRRLPTYMVPSEIRISGIPLPRNPNGKIDRKAMAEALQSAYG